MKGHEFMENVVSVGLLRHLFLAVISRPETASIGKQNSRTGLVIPEQLIFKDAH